MRSALLTAVLLAVECGQSYKMMRDRNLEVSEREVATGSHDGLLYRIRAQGTNSCCMVGIDILNTGPRSVAVTPYEAELTSEKCPTAVQWVGYIAGDRVQDFAAVDRLVSKRGLETYGTDKPLWLLVGRDQQLLVAPSSFLKLSYYAGDFQKRCAPYSFKLRLDSSTMISGTFIEPT